MDLGIIHGRDDEDDDFLLFFLSFLFICILYLVTTFNCYSDLMDFVVVRA